MKIANYLVAALLLIGCGPSEKELELKQELAELKKQQERFSQEKAKSERELEELKKQQERFALEKERSERELLELKKQQERFTVNGSVFVVTKSGQAIKLGLIPVSATPIDIFEEKRKNAISTLEKDYQESSEEFERLKNVYLQEGELFEAKNLKFSEKQKEIATIISENQKTDIFIKRALAISESQNYIRVYDKGAEQNAEALLIKINDLVYTANGIQEEMRPVYDRLVRTKVMLATIQFAANDRLENRVRHFLSSLQTSAVNATSNADGNFVLKLKKSTEYIMTAVGERSFFGESENYNWLNKIEIPSNETEVSVLISNTALIDEIPGDKSVVENLKKLNIALKDFTLPTPLSYFIKI